MNAMEKMLEKRNNRGQTALEYALVVAAISLVLLAAWNTVGKSVKESIEGSMLGKIMNQLEKGNDKYKKGQ